MRFDFLRRVVSRRTAIVCLIALACSGGDDPTGPDNAGSAAVGSITVSAGNNQSVGPGEVVPVRPVLKVLSDRDRPLQGATVAFAIENGGTLDAASVTTDANGEAILPRWGAPLIVGEFAVNATATGSGGSSRSARIAASVTDNQVQSVTQAIPATGGTMTIPANVPPLGGLQIQVPGGSFPGSTTFSIAYGAAPPLPSHLTLASPLIGIAAGSIVADSIIYLTIPSTQTVGTGQVLRAFVLATDNTLIPMSTYQSTTSSITVGITDFRPQTSGGVSLSLGSSVSAAAKVAPAVSVNWGVRILIALWTVPTTGVFSSGFVMGTNNLAFANYGSFAHPGGFCAGSTFAAGGWYLRSPPARQKYPPLMTPAETGDWFLADQLNPAIRLANELQKTYGPVNNSITQWKYDRLVQNDREVWANVLFQLAYGGRPVYVTVWTANKAAGHAILAYKADAATGQIFISDPNYPEDATRTMQWHRGTGTWDPFMASPNRTAPNNTPYVLFADATYLFHEESAGISGIINAYTANGLIASYPRAQGTVTLKSGTVVSINGETPTFDVQSRDNPLRPTFSDIGNGVYHSINVTNGSATPGAGLAITSATVLTVPLKSGQNKIVVVLWKGVGAAAKWFDAKVLTVNRAQPKLQFSTQPSNANEGASLGSVKIALVDEDGGAVNEAKSLTVTLEGGTAGAVLSGGGAVTTLAADGTVTLSGLSVNKAGTGYTLKVTGALLQPVSSASFNIAGGNASFTGRVMHAVTTNGLAGATIVATLVDGSSSGSTTSSGSGDWAITGLSEGTYTIVASLTGFVSTSAQSQVLTAPTTIVEPIPLVPSGTPGGVFGNIRNAINSQLVTSLTTVEARSGMNATTGAVVFSQNTSTGSYALANLPAGVYTLVATNPAFSPASRTGVVVGGGGVIQGPDLVMNPLAGGAAARVVLSWGSTPSDLDSHLTGPLAAGRFWTYFSAPGNCFGVPWACLDVDDTNGNGPETMSIMQITPGVYRYYVYDFSNRFNGASTALRNSGAKVEFYVGATLLRTFFVPGSAGNAWAVFEWDGTTLTVLNQIFVINGTPQPALIVNPPLVPTMMEELQRLSQLPPKPPR